MARPLRGAAGGAAGAAGGAAGCGAVARQLAARRGGGAAGAAARRQRLGAAGGAAGAAGGAAGAAGGAAGAAGGAAGAAGGAAGAAGGAAGAAGGAAGAAGGAAGAAGERRRGPGGGGGGGIACTTAATCPGTDDDCQQRACLGGLCMTTFTPVNTALTAQTPGDCHRAVCDGLGGVLPQIFDSDTPADDSNVCTGEICMNGLPSHPAVQAGTVCTQNGGRLCNGSNAAPACVGCLAVANCPGTDTICQQRTCQDNACGTVNAQAGTAAEADATGNCHKNVCGNTGNVVSQIDNTDTPAEDGNTCTIATCTAGTPAQRPSRPAPRARRTTDACAAARLASSASPPPTARARTRSASSAACSAGNTCGTVNAQAGIDAEPDATGNCHKNVCGNTGNVVSQIDNTDTPAADTNVHHRDLHRGSARATAGHARHRLRAERRQGVQRHDLRRVHRRRRLHRHGHRLPATRLHREQHVRHGVRADGRPGGGGRGRKLPPAVCDGVGGVDSIIDDTDKLVDGNPCTSDLCTAGVASNPPLGAGAICNADKSTSATTAPPATRSRSASCASAPAAPRAYRASRPRRSSRNDAWTAAWSAPLAMPTAVVG